MIGMTLAMPLPVSEICTYRTMYVFTCQLLKLGIMLPLLSPHHHLQIQLFSFKVVCYHLFCWLPPCQCTYRFLIPASFMAERICVSPRAASMVSLLQPRQLKACMARLHQSSWHVRDIQWKNWEGSGDWGWDKQHFISSAPVPVQTEDWTAYKKISPASVSGSPQAPPALWLLFRAETTCFLHSANACSDTKPDPWAHALVTSVSNEKLLAAPTAEALGRITRKGTSL